MPLDLATLAQHYGRSQHPAPPYHLGTRYNGAGEFLPEPGNTIVSHLVAGSETEKALIEAQQSLLAMPEAHKLAFTPIESYHMTLFQGILEGRRKAPYWPEDVAEDTAIAEMTALYQQRLVGFEGGPRFSVEVTAVLPTGLIVDGVSETDRRVMAAWRDKLAELFGYRHPDHDSYKFHITMAYMADWLDDEGLPGWCDTLNAIAEDIRARAPVLELRAPAFCSFADMKWFEELVVLQPKG
ncbi:hypothetical protein WH87_02030 [Devosia epidermidihirudinis]|uniref:DUF1868 domain-containing protein n=1 Tax=Devosia epidermidihirudinis TaxID=1293439 RepID=A0A0F5QJN8_9HYPH|nr:DUF1868 domain-containing protein [Devosia epidermidihirudinis]KKC40956.1 hypothetical protein WH87_02030 [Devosia epidermidihirudinis]